MQKVIIKKEIKKDIKNKPGCQPAGRLEETGEARQPASLPARMPAGQQKQDPARPRPPASSQSQAAKLPESAGSSCDDASGGLPPPVGTPAWTAMALAARLPGWLAGLPRLTIFDIFFDFFFE